MNGICRTQYIYIVAYKGPGVLGVRWLRGKIIRDIAGEPQEFEAR